MFAIRRNDTGEYLTGLKGWNFGKRKDAYLWSDRPKAVNVTKTAVMALSQHLEVIEMTEAEKANPLSDSVISDEIEKLSEMRPENLMKMIKYAFVINEGIGTMIEVYDKKISVSNGIEQDLLHAIEFGDDFTPEEKESMFDRLKLNRKTRRENKDISELLNAFRDGEDIIVKTDKMAARQYRPRQDESLFDDPFGEETFGEDEAKEEEEMSPPQHELLFE